MAEATSEKSGLGRVLDYLDETRLELRKVVWPTREESFNLTIVVIVVMIAVMMVISGLDSILNVVFEALLDAAG